MLLHSESISSSQVPGANSSVEPNQHSSLSYSSSNNSSASGSVGGSGGGSSGITSFTATTIIPNNHDSTLTTQTSSAARGITGNNSIDAIQQRIKEGWTVHTAKDGRLYYCKYVYFCIQHFKKSIEFASVRFQFSCRLIFKPNIYFRI